MTPREPMLASRTFAAGRFDGERVPMFVGVFGGLHMIRGNSAPHFTLTYWAHRKSFPNQRESGGAGHDTILKYWPQFADLAALHLCDIDGVPMHAVANGWYQLAGALGGAGETYHAGNQEYRDNSPTACLQSFAAHCRISLEEATAIRDEFARRELTGMVAKEVLTVTLDAMRPRWVREADACRTAHDLRVFGDPFLEPLGGIHDAT